MSAYDTARKVLDASSIPREARAGVTPAGRRANAEIILREFEKAGLPASWALAAIVNADAESGLWERATPPSGSSHGLFQLHDKGLGIGMSIADRMNPSLATRRIIQEVNTVRRSTRGTELATKQTISRDSMDTTYQQGGTIADMTGAFCFFVERPYQLRSDSEARRQKARELFPSVADQKAASFDAGLIRPSDPTVIEGSVKGGINWPVIMTGGAFVVFAGVAIWWNWQRSSLSARRRMWAV